jgi:exopolysaccharide biosynthesis protein
VRKVAFLLACVLALGAGPAWADTSSGAPVPTLRIPAGYRIAVKRVLAPGLLRVQLVGGDPVQVVNVAVRAAGSPVQLRVVVSNDAVGGPAPLTERTSSMCVRVDCIVAVNGDFFGNVTGAPVGAVVADDQLLRSPNDRHHQLNEAADGTLSTGQMQWRGTLVPSDLQQLALDGVNVTRDRNELVLYTPAEGPATGANDYGAELVLRVVRPDGPIKVGKTTVVRIEELRHGGNTPIPADGAVLSGHGKAQKALEDLWARVRSGDAEGDALLRLDVTPHVEESIGGSPILVRNGKRWFAEENRDLYTLPAPRTMAGWTAAGDLLLVTVDGRQPGYSVGMTMDEAADLMIALGAVEAMNLDGGGSTAFVVNGSVMNRPSDRVVRRDGHSVIVRTPRTGERVVGYVERPVAVALAFIRPKADLNSLVEQPRPSLVIPLGKPGSPAGTTSALVLDGSESPSSLVLPTIVVLLALGVAIVRRRRAGFAV